MRELYSIVIPVYNSIKSLEELTEQIKDVFENQLKLDYEIIFVDDHSPNPQSWETLKQIRQKYDRVTIAQLMRNFGKEGALLAGFSLAKGDYIITMDDDLQHSPYDIPRMIEQKEHDVVIVAFKKKRHTFMQRLTSEMRSWIEIKYMHRPRHIRMTPFKMIRRSVVEQILSIRSAYPFITGYLYYITQDLVNVWGTHYPRKYDKSNFNMRRRWQVFLNLLINNTPFLLKAMINIGFWITILSFITGTVFIIRRIMGLVTLPGWTSIIVLLTFLSGVIILFLGIIGEYLIRILNNVENKPAFVIKQKI